MEDKKMGLDNLEKVLSRTLKELKDERRLKGKEYIITKVKRPEGNKDLRYFLKIKGEQEFIRTNSNSYLGMFLRDEIIQEEEKIIKKYFHKVLKICSFVIPNSN